MKRSFNAYVKKPYNNTLFQNVNTAVQQLTEVAYWMQLFLIDYALNFPNNLPPALLSLNGLYSITQLVRGLPMTPNNARFPKAEIQQHWNGMTATQPNLTTAYTMNTKILSDYCGRQSSCNNLHLSGNFPQRIMNFSKFKLAQLLEEVPNAAITNTMTELLFSHFASYTQGRNYYLTIPATIPVNLHHYLRQVWTDLMAIKPPTLGVLSPRTMAAYPGSFVSTCITINDAYERYNAQEHEEPLKTYSFSILPTSFTNRRFIALVPENIKVRTGYHGVVETIDGPTVNTLPLVSFGAGMIGTNHNHIHGYPVGSANLVRNHMIDRQRRALCAIGHTNEYLTSQICSSTNSVGHTCGTRMDNATIDGHQVYALKQCNQCGKIVNRDKNAASNMHWIMENSLSGLERPTPLSRPV